MSQFQTRGNPTWRSSQYSARGIPSSLLEPKLLSSCLSGEQEAGKPPASTQACGEPRSQDLSALVTCWTNEACDDTEHGRLAQSLV